MLETSLFGNNQHSFARYLEPEAYHAMWVACRRPNIKSYEKRLPCTWQLAHQMLRQLPQPWYWGVQIENGSWPQQRVGRKILAYNGQMVSCSPLYQRDVIKHLVGSTFSLGNCDGDDGDSWQADFDKFHKFLSPDAVRHRPISVLRIDTDQDEPWRRQQIEPIAFQIQAERIAASTLGLGYQVFRTGNRGTQAVMALPCAVPLAVASWLEIAFRRLVEPHRHPTAIIDKSNLTQVLRLPGGVHAKTYQLALWIDASRIELYSIEQQAHLMAHGLFHWRDWPQNWIYQVEAVADDPLTEFQSAVIEMEALLTEWGIGEGTYINEETFDAVLNASPQNALVIRFHTAHSSSSNNSDKQIPTAIWEKEENTSVSSEDNEHRAGGRDWAFRVWMEGYKSGESFHFWTKRGGIRAAFILFGSREKALEALKQQAKDISPSTIEKTRERHLTLEKLVADHNYIPPRQMPMQGEFTPEEQAMTQQILGIVDSNRRMYASRKSLTERLILIFLWKFRLNRASGFQMSYDTLGKAVVQSFGSEQPNRMDVQRALKTLTSGESKCRFRMLESEYCSALGWRKAMRYRPGEDLVRLWDSQIEHTG